MVQRLKQLRGLRGVSQQSLAEVVGVSQQSINKYENQKAEPDIQTLGRLADYFGVTIDYLVGHPAPLAPGAVSCPFELTGEEQQLLEDYRVLTPGQRESILLVMKNFLS